MKLLKYRDAGMSTFTYFWVDSNEHIVSPFFAAEREAIEWAGYRVCTLEQAEQFARNRNYTYTEWDEWKSIK